MEHFVYSDSNKRYHTLDYYYKHKYGQKVFKVSLDAGFSCPNIDGTVGHGGCIYCSKLGSGDFAGNKLDPLIKQFNDIKEILHKKWKNAKYIGYFQAHTNTYAPLTVLKEKYESILTLEHVVGLNIATRPDAIEEDVLNYLSNLNQKTDLTIELGLQTIHEQTSKLINRCHTLECFENMVKKLREKNISVVVHIINGLPYETKQMMLETISYLNHLDIQGIKIHMLHILKDTALANLYQKEKFHVLSKEEYIDIVCDQLEMLRPEIVIHRITGDPKADDLVEPTWLEKKFGVLNDIDKELKRRNTYQGFQKSILNRVHQCIDLTIKKEDIVVDATIGNGNDTLYLAKLVPFGHVFGFDIQKEAIEETKKKLASYSNYTLFLKNHNTINKVLCNYQKKISLVLFNLGYLPKGNKKITTKWESTKEAIEQSLTLLNQKGIILIVVYPGHEQGRIESEHLLKYIDSLPYSHQIYRNTSNINAPYLIEIKKDQIN